MVEELVPKLVVEGVVFDCTRLALLLQLRRLPVSLQLQRKQVGSCSGLEFDIAIDFCTDAVVRVVGLAEFGLDTGLIQGAGTGMGMLGLLL